jgi:hypothetical protein
MEEVWTGVETAVTETDVVFLGTGGVAEKHCSPPPHRNPCPLNTSPGNITRNRVALNLHGRPIRPLQHIDSFGCLYPPPETRFEGHLHPLGHIRGIYQTRNISVPAFSLLE